MTTPEAEFLDIIGTKVLGVFHIAIYITFTNEFYTPSPCAKVVGNWFGM
jgi:hypothetical protein